MGDVYDEDSAMAATSHTLQGVIKGRTIELAEDSGLPDGQQVSVVLLTQAAVGMDGIIESAGACADEADDLDQFLEWSRRQRKSGRAPIEP